MRTLSSIAITEKNKLGTDSVFLLLIKITIPGAAEPVRIAYNTENVDWAGYTWYAAPFQADEISEESKGEVPAVVLRVANVDRVMEQYLQAYDNYKKVNGFAPVTLDLYLVNSKNLGSATPETHHEFDLKSISADCEWAYFTIGAINPWTRRIPLNRILRNQCRFVFKSTECGYVGATTTCNKTFSDCTTRANQERYGGFPATGNRGIRI